VSVDQALSSSEPSEGGPWGEEGRRRRWDLLVGVVEESVSSAIEVAVEDEVPPLPRCVDCSTLPHPPLSDGLVRHEERRLVGSGAVLLSSIQEDISQRLEAKDLLLQGPHPALSLLQRSAPVTQRERKFRGGAWEGEERILTSS
jgi:hypothetical protein